jgi:hypothetical protein
MRLRQGFGGRALQEAIQIIDITFFALMKKKEAATFLSHGKNQDIGASLLGAMAKELGINTSEFIDLVRCPLSTEDYLARKKDRLADALRILKHG